ncbi:LuxR family transcriptional regulator [Gordonia sp. zg691]|uniref:helix-turn-helix transcriptional regulator n=1 Tax=Gordonia jinghuaiqii TaxID=2758710 RepID=UPI001662211A|nr:LuxR C-terminal-related transcriptional regulator [Gordonia jinghuaiqii]MBD0860319.1 LuxR family transcriptional regulator [Gordonia jinghuaiqii]
MTETIWGRTIVNRTTLAAHVDALIELAIVRGHAAARDELEAAVTEDAQARDHVRQAMLRGLLSGAYATDAMRRAAELLTDIEGVRRHRIAARIDSQRRCLDGIREIYTRLPEVPRAGLPVAVTTQVCDSLGFAKSMYSAVRGRVWAPTTIAISRQLGGFGELRRAVDGHVVPQGAAPREEDLMRHPRGMAVEYADTLHDTYKPLIDLSNPQGYVVVPVTVAGQVCAILHADRHDVPIASTDLDALQVVGEVCALAEEAAVVRSRIDSENRRLRDELIAMERVLSDLESTRVSFGEVASGERWDGEQRDGERQQGSANRSTSIRLTAREHEVLREVAGGLPNAEIATRLYMSEGTVKTHLRRVYRKLGISTRSEAAASYRSMYPGASVYSGAHSVTDPPAPAVG